MFQDKDPVARFTTHLNFPDPSNPGHDTWKTKVIMSKYHADFKFKPGENFKYSNEDIELLKTYSAYQTPNLNQKHVKNKFNIF